MTDLGNAVKETATRNGPAVADVYRTAILREAPQVLGLMDREHFSPTCGCMDRTHWAWKFTDFPGARFQEGLCALSYLYSHEFSGNIYFRRSKLLDWMGMGFDYWSNIQYAGGEFDEAYPFERSLAATAFTGFYLSEAWTMIDGALPPAQGSRFKYALRRAGDWLVRNDESHGFLSNHLAAAAAALQHAYRICGDDRFERRSQYFVDKILARQSTEGWYDEYGGADPGYQTHGTFYLARIWQFTQDERLLDSMRRSLKFLAHFVHPDGSLGGEYASRNTQTYYPAAFEMLSGVDGTAGWIAQTMAPSVDTARAAGLACVDAYNYFPLMNNHVFAARACTDPHRGAAPVTPPASGNQHFPQAGLLKVDKPHYVAYVGLHKGGVLKAFDKRTRRLFASDCGYVGRFKNGKLLSSQAIIPDRRVEVTDDRAVAGGAFYAIKKPVMKPLSFLGFRIFSLTVGRVGAAARWLKALLVKVLIYKKDPLDLRFVRTLSFEEHGVAVRDELTGSLGPQLASLEWCDLFTTIHMGSSRYFVENDLVCSQEASRADVPCGSLATGETLERRFVVDGASD